MSLRNAPTNYVSANKNIDVINHNVNVVSGQVAAVEQQLEITRNDLAQLTQEFREFVRQDALLKNVQLAETRLVKVRQELEQKYGHYEDVRRRAIGILQAVDSSLVRKETIGICLGRAVASRSALLAGTMLDRVVRMVK
jgi:hypothetical protein